MSKDGKGDSETTIRYAPYLEDAHSSLLGDDPDFNFMTILNATWRQSRGFSDAVNEGLVASPYAGYESVDIDEGYFGMTVEDAAVTYEIKNFPSLWDMFGKFMAGLDVHDLWGQIYDDIIQGPEIENVIAAQSTELQRDIDAIVMPKFLAGMRDINSVQASSFVVGKAIIQDAHVRELNKFGAQIRMHALDVSASLWTKHLDWNTAVINNYSEMFKLYYASRLDIDRANLEYESKDDMWNINLFENARAMLSAMAGSAATESGNEPSQAQKALGGAMAGAAAGWQVSGGNPMGAVIGGVLGLAASFF